MQYLSPTFGFVGTVLIYFFGVPKQTDTGGSVYLICEQKDDAELAKIKKYKFWGNAGLWLVAVGFLINLLILVIPKIIGVNQI